MQRFPQVLKNIKVKDKVPFDKIPNFTKRMEEIQAALGTRGRVFVRYSGTEPIARVMIEGEDQKAINKYAEDLISLIKEKA